MRLFFQKAFAISLTIYFGITKSSISRSLEDNFDCFYKFAELLDLKFLELY